MRYRCACNLCHGQCNFKSFVIYTLAQKQSKYYVSGSPAVCSHGMYTVPSVYKDSWLPVQSWFFYHLLQSSLQSIRVEARSAELVDLRRWRMAKLECVHFKAQSVLTTTAIRHKVPLSRAMKICLPSSEQWLTGEGQSATPSCRSTRPWRLASG